MLFRDRAEAGRALAEALSASDALRGGETGSALVLAIPRGGVEIGAEVSSRLGIPLDVWLARKIGAPGNPEFAIGSVSINGELILDRASIAALGIPQAYIDAEIRRESEELARRTLAFRGHAEPVDVKDKTVILVDDGVATGATALSALASLRRAGAARRILATPVAPIDMLSRLEAAADAVIVLHAASDFRAVGEYYSVFDQVPDEEVVRLLARARNSARDALRCNQPGAGG